jgi:hypothetical protein
MGFDVLIFGLAGLQHHENVRAKLSILNRFRGVTNEMVERADLNVAFSLHDTAGQLVGGCARKRSQREAICN